MALFDPQSVLTRTPLGILAETETAFSQNLSATLEGTRALINGLSALQGELGRFAGERLQRHGALAGDFTRLPLPATALMTVLDFVSAEVLAWDEEQGRLVALWTQALTESLVTFEDLAELPGP